MNRKLVIKNSGTGEALLNLGYETVEALLCMIMDHAPLIWKESRSLFKPLEFPDFVIFEDESETRKFTHANISDLLSIIERFMLKKSQVVDLDNRWLEQKMTPDIMRLVLRSANQKLEQEPASSLYTAEVVR